MRSSRVGGRDRKIQRKQKQTKWAKRKVYSSTFARRSVVYKSASGGVLCWLTLNGHIPIWRVRELTRIVIKQILIYLAGANVAYFSSSQVHFFLISLFPHTPKTWTWDLIRMSLPLCTLSLDAKQLLEFRPSSSFTPPTPPFSFSPLSFKRSPV